MTVLSQNIFLILSLLLGTRLFAYSIPQNIPKFEIEINQFNGGSFEPDCSKDNLVQFALQNPTSKPIQVALVDDWLLTSGFSITTMTNLGNRKILAKNILHQGGQPSVLHHVIWSIPPGIHNVNLAYNCKVRGKWQFRLMDLSSFIDETHYMNSIFFIFCISLIIVAIYSLAIWIYTRGIDFLFLSAISAFSFLSVFTFLLNRSHGFLLPSYVPYLGQENYIYMSCLGSLISIYLMIRLRRSGYEVPHLRNLAYISASGAFFALIMPEKLYSILFHSLTILVPLLMALLCSRKKNLVETLSVIPFLGGSVSYIVYVYLGPAAESFVRWLLPVGLVLLNFILILGLMLEVHAMLLAKSERENQILVTKHNLQIANTVQNRFMHSGQYESIATYFLPADNIGGDWYRHFSNRKGNLVYLFVGDVTGHGVKSAYMTALVAGGMNVIENSIVEGESLDENNLRKVAEYFNHLFYINRDRLKLSMTFACIAVDQDSGDFMAMNISHPPALLVSSEGLKPIVSRGEYLGLKPSIDPEVSHFKIKSGEQLFIYTDGLLENGEEAQLKIRDLKNHISATSSPSENVEKIRNLTEKTWQQEIEDDVTYLIYKFNKLS